MKKVIVFVSFICFFMSVLGVSEHWPTGYYSTVEEPENAFYYNDEYRWYCHVQNATQSSLYDVASQIRIVGDVYSFLSQATSLEECSWPNGFYKVAGTDGPIYRLYPGNICEVTSAAMLAAYGGTDAVTEAEENSDFGAHRTWIGQCFWPSYDAGK